MAAAFALVLPACGGAGPAEAPRNLLLLTIDTLRADHLSVYGYHRATSPHIDRLAGEGVVFERAYSVASWTLPSIASLMTSLYPSAHACQSDRSALGTPHATLAEHLALFGFRTAAVTSHLYLSSKYGLEQGFAQFDEELVQQNRRSSHAAVTSPAITEKGLAFLEERARLGAGERWFLWLHFFDPHSEYKEHPGTIEPFGSGPMDRYDGEISFTDRHVGRVLARLDELGLAQDTLVVLIADHGEEFMDHGGGGHRATLYDEVLRVPLILRAATLRPARVLAPVSCVDLLPTLCELLDVAAPGGVQGRSLAALLRGDVLAPRALLAEMRNRTKRDWDGLVEGQFKLLHDVTNDRRQLFDLVADPRELDDIAADHPELVDSMWARMQAMIAASAEHASRQGEMPTVELMPEDQRALDQLGYGGED